MSRGWRIAIAVGIFGVVAGAAFLFWFFGGEAPGEVDLSETASAVTDDETTSESSVVDSLSNDGSAGIEGTWTVDDSVGTFTVDDETTATFVGFRVEEELSSVGSNTAVGRTPEVSGNMTIEGTTLTTGSITADLTKIVSDEPRRDNAIQRSLGTTSNAEATFVLTEPIELGSGAAEGEPISATAVGELTINGMTNAVEFALEAQLIDGMILVTGTTDVVFADYGITAPTAPAVLSVDDHGVVEIQLWLSAV